MILYLFSIESFLQCNINNRGFRVNILVQCRIPRILAAIDELDGAGHQIIDRGEHNHTWFRTSQNTDVQYCLATEWHREFNRRQHSSLMSDVLRGFKFHGGWIYVYECSWLCVCLVNTCDAWVVLVIANVKNKEIHDPFSSLALFIIL